MRLIDADALLDKLIKTPRYFEVKFDIEESPTINVEPVIHAHWISFTDCSNAGIYCSHCHKKVYKEDYALANKKNKLRSNYCPNCGSKMDEQEENY